MRKICMLVGYYPINRGGAEYQSYLLAKKLREDHEVFYISIGQREDAVIEHDGFCIYTFRIPWGGRGIFRLKAPILKILKIEQPHIIYQGVGCAATGIAACHKEKSDCSVIWHIASEYDLERPKVSIRTLLNLRYIDQRYLLYGINHVDCIVGQAQYQDALLRSRFGRHCDAIVRNFQPEASGPIDKHLPIKIVWLANVKTLKRPELFLQLAHAFKHRTDVAFIMAGRDGGPRWSQLIRDHENVLANFTYRGELSTQEVDLLLREAHVLVNTSIVEGYPNTFIEAWMRQTPIVSMDVNPDGVLTEHGIGFVSKTLDGLIADVGRLVDQQDLRERMGKKAYQYASTYHSLNNIALFLAMLQRLEARSDVLA